ncbi:MAG TPA: hypothetical protein VN428_10760 [Bryobacteraceae bacterium]|nr:hypothetical protein [Bryobacteraceae bacterium]
MESHIKALGILNIILGALGALMAIGLLLMFGGIGMLVGTTSGDPDAHIALPILGAIGGVVFIVMLVMSVPVILTGWGLLNFKPWARVLGIVVSAFQLLNIPIGTAAGIYGLWVLLNTETVQILEQRSRRPYA